ncbi:amidohydrolase family protein [Persicitalea jodogahamensis]|uniref:Amidohydrolase n=1 Tax=Persicitalea jodogahamensis TaxID=402147 RepID=A0A8J3G7Z5_9BACT|nr:amidohydrolase family protein [Persicitalea jodogahamensis]GHB60578.1 amidohydrolase [Persicitalea jodogahamensis]
MRIDAHQHFWYFDPIRDAWIDEQMKVIRRDFLPEDLKQVLAQNQIDGCVAVQASQDDAETEFLLKLAGENDFIKGVVGWIDLQADDLGTQLEKYQGRKLLKGFRHVLQGESEEFMLRPAFVRGVKLLHHYGYTYDILIFPNQLPNAVKLVAQCPEQRFVLDHLAKPYIKAGKIADWEKDLNALAAHENVSCKISGMITEADYRSWTYEQLVPYLDVAFEAFGPNRLMFGSDWPVCLVAGEYQAVKDIVEKYTATFSAEEKAKIFGLNAERFYNLS